MSERIVRVTAGSRLHFGMLSFGHPNQQQFGGVGAMISAPVTKLAIRESDRFGVTGRCAERVEGFVNHLARHTDWWRHQPPFHVTVEAASPAHWGLGSGTQLGMALALGLAKWHGAPPQSPEALAQAVGRGRRSAVGIHGACLGGLIVEGGKLTEGEISPLISRIALPDAWRFALILPDDTPDDGAGLSGEAEQQAFERLPPVPAELTGALCRELLCELAPAAVRGDFERFSEALYRYGRLAGECFFARQGGVYAGADIERLVMRCREAGIDGVGQSSWGPTVFALTRDQHAAEDLIENLCAAGELRRRVAVIAAPDNGGSKVEESQQTKPLRNA